MTAQEAAQAALARVRAGSTPDAIQGLSAALLVAPGLLPALRLLEAGYTDYALVLLEVEASGVDTRAEGEA